MSNREPLLPPEAPGDHEDEQQFERDWAHVPQWRRPSVFWLLGPFFLFAVAFGGVAVPRLNIILDLVCRDHYLAHPNPDGTDIIMPVIGGDRNDMCQTADVHAETSRFMLWMALISGLLSAFTSPRLGSLSDRLGRRWLICFSSAGLLAAEITTILCVEFPGLPTSLLLVGALIDGLCGSFMLAMALSYAYGADCTVPRKRAIAFGAFQGCLFTGIAVGPVLGGLVVEATGNILSIFYGAVVVHMLFMVYVVTILPESISPRRLQVARDRHKQEEMKEGENGEAGWMKWHPKRMFRPLKILYPTGPGSSKRLRWNLMLLAAIDSTLFGVAVGSVTVVLLYAEKVFGWRNFESSAFLSIVNSVRVTMLFLILPALVHLFRRPSPSSPATPHHGADTLDITLIRFAIVMEASGYFMYALAKSGGMYTFAGAWVALGGVGSPTVQSTLTKHVPNSDTGKLLGGMALLHSLARVVAPIVFNLVYAETVGTAPKTTFVCLASTFSVAFVCSWFLKKGVRWDGIGEGTRREV